jgi:hypothetical protein
MVDMENGAGLDYTDSLPDPTANPPYEGGDMWGKLYPGVSYDKFHPNDKGNTKMAVKYYEELVKELAEPEKIENNKVEVMEFISNADSNIIVTWISNFLDEDGYIIERALPGGEFAVVDTADANTFFLIDSSANAVNEYDYRIKAFNATGESLYSSAFLYVPVYYNLTILIDGQGTASPEDGLFLSGTSVTLTATAEQGWEFYYWSGISEGFENPKSVIIDSDITTTLRFKELETQINTQTGSVHGFYPNPVNDKLIIELKNELSRMAVIQLFDNAGRLILNEKVQGLRHILDMAHLSPGIYLIKVSDKNKESLCEYIVKR